ncbi:hypothetical protein MRX96_014416 [Rhipicephalus microplus]
MSFADMLRHIDGMRSYVCTRDATDVVLLDISKLKGKLLQMGLKKVQKKPCGFFFKVCAIFRYGCWESRQ